MKLTVLACIEYPSKGVSMGSRLIAQAAIIVAKVTRKSPAFFIAPKQHCMRSVIQTDTLAYISPYSLQCSAAQELQWPDQ